MKRKRGNGKKIRRGRHWRPSLSGRNVDHTDVKDMWPPCARTIRGKTEIKTRVGGNRQLHSFHKGIPTRRGECRVAAGRK